MTDDIGRRGLAAAEQVVDRLISTVDGPEPSEPPAAPPAAELDAVAGLWRESVRRLADVFGDAGLPFATTPRFDVAGSGSPGVVRLVVDPASGRGETEVWVHNSTTEPVAAVVLHCSPPVGPDGGTLDAGCVRFEPNGFELPARSSRGVTVSAEGVAAGTVHRAVVQARGIADQWLPMEIDAR